MSDWTGPSGKNDAGVTIALDYISRGWVAEASAGQYSIMDQFAPSFHLDPFENRFPGTSFDAGMFDAGLGVWHIMEDPAVYNAALPPPNVPLSNWSMIGSGWQRKAIRSAALKRTVAAAYALLALTTASCSFEGSDNSPEEFCAGLDTMTVTPATSTGPTIVAENPGTLIVLHGSTTAAKDQGDFIRTDQAQDLPTWVDRATIFLNGWRASYAGDVDHHVIAVGSVIGRISFDSVNDRLHWNAAGILRDNRGRPYNWTYTFTIIGWNSSRVDMNVNHDDADNVCKANTGGTDNFYFSRDLGATALSSYHSFLQDSTFVVATAAVLPRGFGFVWRDYPDRHLLHTAYNLDHSERFAEYGRLYRKAHDEIPAPVPDSTSLVGAGFLSWNTYSVLKDNALKRDYIFGELVSAVGGEDIALLQPPFSILPGEDGNAGFGEAVVCQQSSETVRTEEVVVANVPFDYAIPMLAGWGLEYPCDDEHVREIGVWIDAWSYQKEPGAASGVLRYTITSVLGDRDGDPGHVRSHKVAILGIRSSTVVPPTEPSTPLPDTARVVLDRTR